MSSSDISRLVEKFPQCTVAERDQLLQFARTTPLVYGEWQPFKQLFKKAEAELHNAANSDKAFAIELMAVLIHRIDGVAHKAPEAHWRPTEETQIFDKEHTVSANGMSFRLGKRKRWDHTGWRLLVSPHAEAAQTGVLGVLRRAIGAVANVVHTTNRAFDFEANSYIYEIKNVTAAHNELKIVCGSPHRWNRQPDQEFFVDISDPEFIHLRGQGPKNPTLQYMKRRARRSMREMNRKHPALYVQLALQLFQEYGSQPFDPALNWALADTLFAKSPRWRQLEPGRGPYQKVAGKFVLKRREERAPALWDAHLDQVRAILASETVPLEANEMALKVLRSQSNNLENISLSSHQLSRFLNSNLPVLQSFATHGLAAADAGQIDVVIWASLMLLGNARTRRLLIEPGRVPSNGLFWNGAAANVFVENLTNGTPSKKRRAANVLVEYFGDSINENTLWDHLSTFAAAGTGAREWMLQRMRQSARAADFSRLLTISQLTPELRAPLLQIFSEEAAQLTPAVEQAMPLVAGNDQSLNEVGWHILSHTAMTRETARELWQRFWSSRSPFMASTHATAARSEGAFQLFKRAEFSGEELETALETAPLFFESLSPNFFAAVFRRIAPSLQIERALIANDEQWRAAREVLLQTLQEPAALGAFWTRVLERVVAGGAEAPRAEDLNRRILDDRHIVATFEQLPKAQVADLFSQTDEAYEPYLLRWLQVNGAQLERGDAALLAIATHASAAFRQWGLNRLGELGLDLPLALRLLESGLPEPFALGRTWFEQESQIDFIDRVLALCDSPEAAVRRLGREFLEAHGAHNIDAATLRKLAENSDPIMQAWLAEHLLRDAPDVQVAQFDQAILRTRGRARRAKEAIKKRHDVRRDTVSTPQEFSDEYIAALLDVARGRTRRDREWALQQLALASLAGHRVEGLQVEGVQVGSTATSVQSGHEEGE